MTRFLFTLLLLISAATTASAASYTISKDGVFFTTKTDVSFDHPTTQTKSNESCSPAEFLLEDPAGGRGVVVQECSSKLEPFARYRVLSKSVDSSRWSQCKLLGRDGQYLNLFCPKIFSELHAED